MRNHIMLLGRADGDPYGRDLDWRHSDILNNGWRLRQEPGPWNALGSLLFDLPNAFDVYLHDTPSRSLFANADRALSHGCIRVEAAWALAKALLGVPVSSPAIGPLTGHGETKRVALADPVAVYLVYLTAFVDETGTVEFRDDIYGRDQRLVAALAGLEHAPAPAGSLPVSSTKACPDLRASLAAAEIE
jgi:murein L,D-transpeptidase YcbB/YkuD